MTLEQNPWPGNLAHRVRTLASPDARIALLWGDLTCDSALAADLARWLAPAEQARAARFGTDALRERYVIGRATLRAVLARQLDTAPQAVELARGRRGRPHLADAPGIDFNVSHTGDVVLIAIARAVTVGVDIERTDRAINTPGIAQRCLTAAEREALSTLDAEHARRRVLQLWTCKEAMSKATGDALGAPFRRLDVVLSPGPRLCTGPPPYTAHDWTLHAIDASPDYFATLAVWSAAPAAPG